MSDFEAGKAPKDLSKNDITALACKYGIASSLTSLIAVDTSANRAADGSLVQVAGNDEVRDSYGQPVDAVMKVKIFFVVLSSFFFNLSTKKAKYRQGARSRRYD